jgi:hypothetical protein
LIADTKKGYTLQLTPWGKQRGLYLSCDATGKKKSAFLTKKPTAGSYWNLSNIGGPKPTTVSPARGKLKDWYLALGRAERLKDKDGKAYTTYQAILTDKTGAKVYIYPVAP